MAYSAEHATALTRTVKPHAQSALNALACIEHRVARIKGYEAQGPGLEGEAQQNMTALDDQLLELIRRAEQVRSQL